eukprot:7653337-Pyramimonas_sp.AAC.1
MLGGAMGGEVHTGVGHCVSAAHCLPGARPHPTWEVWQSAQIQPQGMPTSRRDRDNNLPHTSLMVWFPWHGALLSAMPVRAGDG